MVHASRWGLVSLALASIAWAGCGEDDDGKKPVPDVGDTAVTDAGDTSGGDTEPGDDTTGPDAADTDPPDAGEDAEADAADAGPEPDVAPDAGPEPFEPDPRTYSATIRRGTYGIPHITGASLGDVAFGQAYAYAENNVCTLADQIVKVRSERAKHFAGRGVYNDTALIDSDFAYKHLKVVRYAEEGIRFQPPEVQEAIRGYVAGYNQYLAETPASERPEWCRDAEWVQPISEIDLMAYYLDLALLGSARPLLTPLATAAPPRAGNKPGPAPELPDFRNLGIGSNGWGIGRDRTDNGRGALIGNPHFPWEGELRLWESHLTIPGELNVYGAALNGVVGVLIGFNDHVAWTHTVSAAPRFTVYRLKLVPGAPTKYLYDGEEREMEATEYTIAVRQTDGTTTEESRTMYRSHYGPILNIAPFGWTRATALTFRDANENNQSLIPQFLGMNKARSLEEFQAVHDEVNGIPWVNTMYADREGNAFYVDSSAVPNLPPEVEARWKEARVSDPIISLLWSNGVVLLEGDRSSDEWVTEADSRRPGLVPYRRAPKQVRADFIFNANDSHWLTNPLSPLEGYPELYGGEREPRSPRTRQNARQLLEAAGSGSASGEDGKFSLAELESAVVGNRSIFPELLLEDVVARCEGAETVTIDGTAVALAPACAVLSSYGGTYGLDDAGAVLWREFLAEFPVPQRWNAGTLFAEAFDPADPVGTPRGLTAAPATGPDPVLVALGRAILRLQGVEIPLDATLGDWQFTLKGEARIPVHGGLESEGLMNKVDWGTSDTTLLPKVRRSAVISPRTGLTADGYWINNGSSFILAVSFTDEGPRARAIVTYSQAWQPESPYFADQTEVFGEGTLRDVRFSEADIVDDPALTTTTVTGAD